MVAVGFSKFLLVGINVIFMLFGLASLITGIVFKLNWDVVRDAFVDNSEKVDVNLHNAGDTIAYGAIVFGAFIIFVSLLGCIGACCRVRCLLTLYVIIVVLLLISEVIAVVLVVRMGSHKRKDIARGLKDSLNNYYEDSTNPRSKAFSAIFSTMKCCGIQNYTDFTTDQDGVPFHASAARDVTQYPLKIPIACCRGVDYEGTIDAAMFDKYSECLQTPTAENAYVNGCMSFVEDLIEHNKNVVMGVGITIFVIEVLVVITSLVLCCHKEDYEGFKV